MADSGKNATTTHTGDDATTTFSVGFAYESKTFVEVRVGGVLKARPTDWDFSTDGLSIVFVAAPTRGTAVVFTRVTGSTPVHTFKDGIPPTGDALNATFRQLLHFAQETEDSLP